MFGKTGVGKSTLINAIFGEEVARTGIGEPVTRGSHLYLDKIGHLGIVDTQGLEIGTDDKEILDDLNKVIKNSRKLPLSEQIHVAWYCVRGMDRRFEDTEADFVRRLDELGLPVIIVMTQVPRSPDGRLPPRRGRCWPSRSGPPAADRRRPGLHDLREAGRVHRPASYGLREVLDATFRVAPEGVHGALVAAQEIDLSRKAKEAQA